MEVTADINNNNNNTFTQDLLDSTDNVDIFQEPWNDNRRVLDPSSDKSRSAAKASTTFIPPTSRRSALDDNGTAKNNKTKLVRKAFVEVPVAVSEEEGLKIAPNARMSMQSSFPLLLPWFTGGSAASHVLQSQQQQEQSSKQQALTWSGRLQASAVVRGYTGYTTQDASITCDAHKKLSLQTGLLSVRNRRKIYIDAKTQWGKNQNGATLSARYTQLATTAWTRRGAHVSLAASSQGLPWGTLFSSCHIPLDDLPSLSTPLTASLAWASKTVHPWRVNVTWNELRSFSWNWSTTAKLSDYQTLRVAVGQVRQGIWTWSGNFGQSIRDKMTFHVALSHNASQGTMWILSWSNGDFSLNVPISFLDFQDMWASVVLSAMTKLVQDAVALTLRLDKQTAEAMELEQSAFKQKQEAARSEALNQQSLMKRQAQSRMKMEQENNGLIILSATYFIPSLEKTSHLLDVTIPLQFWVSDGSLQIPAGSKKNLLGFCDVASDPIGGKLKRNALEANSSVWSTKWWLGFIRLPKRSASASTTKPKLEILYEFKGRRDKVVLQDEEKVVLPLL